jgi:hypothetical protein
MKLLRGLIVIIVIIYAGWIAFPVVKAYLTPQDSSQNVPSMARDSGDYSGGFDSPMPGDEARPVTDSIQGDTAVTAIETHNTPVIWLWGGVIIMYLLAAFLHANGNLRAAAAYGLAFLADLALTYLTNGEKGGGLYDKIVNVLSGWDPRYVLTLVAMVLGYLIYMSRNRSQSRLSARELQSDLRIDLEEV